MLDAFFRNLKQVFASKKFLLYPFFGVAVFFVLFLLAYFVRQQALLVFQEHSEALKQGNLKEAYDLTSSFFQDEVSYTVFENFFLFSASNLDMIKIKEKDTERRTATILAEFTFKDGSPSILLSYVLSKDSGLWRISSIDGSKKGEELKAIGVGVPAITSVQLGSGLSEEPSVLREQTDFDRYESIDMVGQVFHVQPGAELNAVLYNMEQDRQIAEKTLNVPDGQDSFKYFFSFKRGEEGHFVGNYEIRLKLRVGGDGSAFIYQTYSLRVI
ncbi:MAG: hypothetical protein HYY51_04635 [Candidatus Magasanikbacteria bacterium]|nr:hypothetical protein [Candidatus Magasanikbacteria bacterium]